jgi:hypothetical protein
VDVGVAASSDETAECVDAATPTSTRKIRLKIAAPNVNGNGISHSALEAGEEAFARSGKAGNRRPKDNSL